VTLRTSLLVFVPLAIALAFVPQAAGKVEPKAKFKVLSASGREALSFQEDGEGCVGATSSEVSWESTRPATVYVFVKRVSAFHGQATILSTDRTLQSSFEIVPLVGRATVSRSVSYQETANCQGEPTECPQTTGSAKPFLSGTPDAGGSVNGGLDIIHLPPGLGDCDRLAYPYTYDARAALGEPEASAFAIPRKRLLDRDRKLVKGSATVEESLGGTRYGVTATGTFTDHLTIKLKRLAS
jgi:hypothetical protein